MISMQGELKKKAKDKDAAKAKESPAAEPGAESPPPEAPSEPGE
jgi:hypothetical protein